MKKRISQNKDNFLIKEAKNVISFHAKNFTGKDRMEKAGISSPICTVSEKHSHH